MGKEEETWEYSHMQIGLGVVAEILEWINGGYEKVKFHMK